VDVAITDSVLAVMESVVSEYSATGECRARVGTKLPGIAPSNLYPTADQSWVIIAANNDGLFKRLSKVMGRPELATDERYATHEARGRHQDELDELIAVWTATCDRDALLDRLLDSGVPAGPVYDARDVAGDAHFRERGSVIDVAMEGIGRLAMQGVVPKLSGTPGGVRWAGQALGRDTEAVLAELLNLTPIEIDALKEQRIV
jgi:formyl-CoA transferase/succinyl-CoA--D-citramalate CoA-transferase